MALWWHPPCGYWPGLTACSAVGTILAVYGSEQDDGRFLVEDLCFADLPPPLPWTGPSSDRSVSSSRSGAGTVSLLCP